MPFLERREILTTLEDCFSCLTLPLTTPCQTTIYGVPLCQRQAQTLFILAGLFPGRCHCFPNMGNTQEVMLSGYRSLSAFKQLIFYGAGVINKKLMTKGISERDQVAMEKMPNTTQQQCADLEIFSSGVKRPQEPGSVVKRPGSGDGFRGSPPGLPQCCVALDKSLNLPGLASAL